MASKRKLQEDVEKKQIPIGVKVISVLYFLFAIIDLIILLFIFKLTGIIPPERPGTPVGIIFTIYSISALISQDLLMIGALTTGIPYLAYIVYLLPIGLAVLAIFVGRGLWKLQKWSKNVAIIWAVLGVVLSGPSIVLNFGLPLPYILIHIIGFSINLCIASYLLFNKNVKSAFR